MKCGVPSCKYRAKLYGVCGLHKNYAYTWNDIQFQKDMKVYENLIADLVREDDELRSKGYDILEIESYLSGKDSLPEHLKVAGKLIEKIPKYTRELQKRYDHYLVNNAMARVMHSYLNCNCELCGLGVK